MPWDVAEAGGVAGDVDDDGADDEERGGAACNWDWGFGRGVVRVSVGREDNVVEGCGAADEGEDHDGDGEEENAATAEAVN